MDNSIAVRFLRSENGWVERDKREKAAKGPRAAGEGLERNFYFIASAGTYQWAVGKLNHFGDMRLALNNAPSSSFIIHMRLGKPGALRIRPGQEWTQDG